MLITGSEEIPITVELQDMFSYSRVGCLVVGIVLGLLLLGFLIYAIVKLTRRKKKVKPIKVNTITQGRLARLKEKYNRALDDIAKRHENKKISDRAAYQELSRVIRHFVYDVSGIKVQNYTLAEIKEADIPQLYYLIAECYKPEFDAIGKGDAQDTISKARKVIGEWN